MHAPNLRSVLVKLADMANPLTVGETLVDMLAAAREKGSTEAVENRIKRVLHRQSKESIGGGITRDAQTRWEMDEYKKFLKGSRKARPTSAEAVEFLKPKAPPRGAGYGRSSGSGRSSSGGRRYNGAWDYSGYGSGRSGRGYAGGSGGRYNNTWDHADFSSAWDDWERANPGAGTGNPRPKKMPWWLRRTRGGYVDLSRKGVGAIALGVAATGAGILWAATPKDTYTSSKKKKRKKSTYRAPKRHKYTSRIRNLRTGEWVYVYPKKRAA